MCLNNNNLLFLFKKIYKTIKVKLFGQNFFDFRIASRSLVKISTLANLMAKLAGLRSDDSYRLPKEFVVQTPEQR